MSYVISFQGYFTNYSVIKRFFCAKCNKMQGFVSPFITNNNLHKIAYVDDVWSKFFDISDDPIHVTESQNIWNYNENCFIHDVIFSSFTSKIIYSANHKMLIYRSLFKSNFIQELNTIIQQKGGAFVLYQVCSINSEGNISSSNALFLTSENTQNIFIDTSFSDSSAKCPFIKSNYREFLLKNANISNIYANTYYSFLECWFNELFISFSTFSNLSSIYAFYHYSNTGKFHHLNMKKINTQSYSIIRFIFSFDFCKSIIIYNSTFSENTRYIVYANGNSQITISQCYFSQYYTSKTENGAQVNISTTNSLSLELSHIKLVNCTDFKKNYISIQNLRITNNPMVKGVDTTIEISMNVYWSDVDTNVDVII